MFSAAELEKMIRATGGLAVTVGLTTTYGHRDEVEDALLGDDGAPVYATRDIIRVAYGILPALTRGTAITVDGESLQVGDHRRVEDGSLLQIELEEV